MGKWYKTADGKNNKHGLSNFLENAEKQNVEQVSYF